MYCLKREVEETVSDKKLHRIGIMGGTFDPVHIGHLILGEKAFEQFHLEKVLFMPSGNPPHKTHREGASNEDRVEMVRLAIHSNPHFQLSLEEMHEKGYIYTSHTLARLKERHPDTEYYFIMGADSLLSFDTWHCPEDIARLCIIVVAIRDHLPMPKLDEQIQHIREKYSACVEKLSTPNLDVSSSLLRKWIQAGESCRYYIPDDVITYMEENRLYLNDTEI